MLGGPGLGALSSGVPPPPRRGIDPEMLAGDDFQSGCRMAADPIVAAIEGAAVREAIDEGENGLLGVLLAEQIDGIGLLLGVEHVVATGWLHDPVDKQAPLIGGV